MSVLLLLLVLAGAGLMLHKSRQPQGDSASRPPVWPPRQPADWGASIRAKHQRAVKAAQWGQVVAQSGGIRNAGMSAPVRPPVIPSWEERHAAEQSRDPLQIRWAQSETGEWVKVVWGNAGRRPAGGGPLPVVQAMKRRDTGAWVWVGLGLDVLPDWQSGPSRLEPFRATGEGGREIDYLRPCGTPDGQETREFSLLG
jgi:hypothetical protein